MPCARTFVVLPVEVGRGGLPPDSRLLDPADPVRGFELEGLSDDFQIKFVPAVFCFLDII